MIIEFKCPISGGDVGINPDQVVLVEQEIFEGRPLNHPVIHLREGKSQMVDAMTVKQVNARLNGMHPQKEEFKAVLYWSHCKEVEAQGLRPCTPSEWLALLEPGPVEKL